MTSLSSTPRAEAVLPQMLSNKGARPAHIPEGARRFRPRLTDTDWLMLRDLRRSLEAVLDDYELAGRTAIDFGCGERPYEQMLTDRGAAYLGADLEGSAEMRIDASGRLDAPDLSADLVLSFQVLEHVRDLDTYFAEARRVMREEGLMVLSTHGTWFYHPHPEDHRRWTREGLVNEIETRGFEVIRCEPIVGPLAWTTMIRLTALCFAVRALPLVGRPLAAALAAVTNLRMLAEEAVTPAWVKRDNACVYLTVSRRAGP